MTKQFHHASRFVRRGRSTVLSICLLLIFTFVSRTGVAATAKSAAQSAIIQVTGTVTDANDQFGIPGVNVSVIGTTTGTVTDIDGNYLLEVADESAVLRFSFTGYAAQEVTVGKQTNIDIALSVDVQTLDQVVVVGYGVQNRSNVTGAISQIDSKEITQVPVLTADQALQGRVAGATVINSGSPGADPIVRIRGLATAGSNSPLIVVDGVIVQGLGDVNPTDIETINVLKDASTTAVFGALGANGVILVTTKSGSSGKPKVSLDTYVGTQRVINRYDLMNTEQYIQYADNWNAATGRLNDPEYVDFINNDTDWQDEIFQDGLFRSHNLGVSGGNEYSDFRIGAGYIKQEGVLLNTQSDRYNFRANSNYQVGKLKIGETLSTSFTTRTPENSGGGRSALEHAIKMAPYISVRNPDNLGGFQGPDSSLDGQDAENPVRVLTHPQNQSQRFNFLGSIFAEYEIIDGLILKGQAGLDYWNFTNDNFTPSYKDGGAHSQNFALINKGSGTHTQGLYFASLSYNKQIGRHGFDALLLAETIESKDTRVGATSTNSITDEIDNLTNVDQNIGSFKFEYKKYGYLGRLNYNFDSKYLLAGSYRRDASSRFGANNRWAPFYSVAAGWVISKEDFFPAAGFINNLKLRLSHGTVGNDRIGEYRYSSSITTGSYNYTFVGPSGEYLAPGTTAGNVANPDLRWEQTTMNNIGIDIGLLQDQITFSAEYFQNKSEDLLIDVSLIPSLGGHNGRGPQNVGSVESSGFEFLLGFKEYSSAFKWSVDINLGTANNKVLSLGGEELNDGNFEGENILRSIEGEALFHFYGKETNGIFQSEAEVATSPLQNGAQAGDIRFNDLSGPDGVPDGVIDDFDKTVLGNAFPDFTFGFSLNASYKNFDLNLFVNGVYGNEIYNTNLWDLEGVQRFFNASPTALNAWTPSNTNTDIPRLNSDPINLVVSDRFIEDGSFARLKNITLGYTLPTHAIKNAFSSLRIYVSAQNLVTITNYSGLDPEVGSSVLVGNSARQQGIDRGNYPQPQTFIGGIQINF